MAASVAQRLNRLRRQSIWLSSSLPGVDDGREASRFVGDLWIVVGTSWTGRVLVCKDDSVGAASWVAVNRQTSLDLIEGTTAAAMDDCTNFIPIRESSGSVVGYIPVLSSIDVTPTP